MSYIRRIREKMGSECVFNPGVRAIILNDEQQVLLQRRSDMSCWGLPAGGVELGETALDALKREVFEETGLRVLNAEPMALYSGPNQKLKYPNGDEIQGFALAFIIREWEGCPCADGEEGLEVKFWGLGALPENILPMHAGVLEDFQNYDGSFMLAE